MLQNCSTSMNQSRKPEWSVVHSWSETKHNYRAKKSGRLWLPSDFEVEFFASLASAPPLVFHSTVVPDWLNITAPHTSLMGSRFLEGKTFTYRFWIAIIAQIRWMTTVLKACEATWTSGHLIMYKDALLIEGKLNITLSQTKQMLVSPNSDDSIPHFLSLQRSSTSLSHHHARQGTPTVGREFQMAASSNILPIYSHCCFRQYLPRASE